MQKLIKISNLNLPTIHEISLPLQIKELIKALSEETSDIYLVGGFVRDMVLRNSSYDLDFIVVNKNAVELGKELALKFDGNSFILDKITGTTRVVLKDNLTQSYTFDFTSVLESNLDADFARRDFTINALAIKLREPDTLIDKFSGLDDLTQKKVKAISLKNLLEDPLRFVRAFRFASHLQGDISPETYDFICENLTSFNDSVAAERISTELWKILDNKQCSKYIKKMAESGLLEKIIPELIPMKKVTPNDHHHLWLFDHSLELIKTFEENFYKMPEWAQAELEAPFGNLDSPKKNSIAKLGCLLHDVGKPDTWEIKSVNATEKHTFYGHDKLGAELTDKISERLKFSNSIRQSLEKLVRYHLRPYQLSQPEMPITEKALFRFFRDVNEDTTMLLMLSIADSYATLGPKITKDDLEKNEKLLLFLLDEYKKYRTKEIEKASKPKLIDGNEIMKLTGMKPSKKLGDIIKELDESIAVGEILTKDDAIKWIMTRVKS